MKGPDEQDLIQWQDALRWMERAAEDIQAARVLLRDDIALQAAFHIQQATEKTLKALSVAARQDVRKTHDLTTLSAFVHQFWPDIVKSPFPLAYVSRWYMISRYPDYGDTGPTDDEIRMALPDIETLFSSVMSQTPGALADKAKAIMNCIK